MHEPISMPSGKVRSTVWHLVRATFCLLGILALSASCSSPSLDPSLGQGADGGVIAACQDGAEQACGFVIAKFEDRTDCFQGKQVCHDGQWGECGEKGPITTKSIPTSATRSYSTKTLGSPSTCTSDLCNPYCYNFPDTPSGTVSGGGLTYADGGGITTSSKTPATFTRVFQGVCPVSRQLVWRRFTWDTSDPTGSNVTFVFKTATTSAGLAGAMPPAKATVAVANGADPVVCKAGCAKELATYLTPSNNAYLEMDATLNPGSGGSPSLNYWNVTYDCIPITVKSIAVTPNPVSLYKSQSQQFTAIATLSDGTTRDYSNLVSWASSDTTVFTIGTYTGLGNAVGGGMVTVTATDFTSGVSGSATVTVKTAPVLVSLTITPSPAWVILGTPGNPLALTATGTISDGSTKDYTGSVKWASSAPAVGTVTAAGVFTGVSVGVSNVTATDPVTGVVGTLKVRVILPPATLATGESHTCALTGPPGTGGVSCWGDGTKYCQLGNSSGTCNAFATASTAPLAIGVANVMEVAAGAARTCALRNDGTVMCWGCDVVTMTCVGTPYVVPGLNNVLKITVGGNHACALLEDNTVKCFGSNQYGQLGDGTNTDSILGTLATGVTTAQFVSAGGFHTCAVLLNGNGVCWGLDFSGQLGNGSNTDSKTPVTVSGLNNAIRISAGPYDSCATLSDGSMKCWGNNGTGELGDNSAKPPTSSNKPVPVSGMNSGIQVSAGCVGFKAIGDFATCGTRSTGVASCWGSNFYGQLGDGTGKNTLSPTTNVAFAKNTTVSEIRVGTYHACARATPAKGVGGIYCWGTNTFGQVGDGTTTARTTPVKVL